MKVNGNKRVLEIIEEKVNNVRKKKEMKELFDESGYEGIVVKDEVKERGMKYEEDEMSELGNWGGLIVKVKKKKEMKEF